MDYPGQATFVTLTYNPESLPERALLHKPDIQKFFKNLRNKGFKPRFFGCGEYGPTGLRPHYHMILYGLPTATPGSPTHQLIKKCWWNYEKDIPRGNVDVGDVTNASISYVAGYTLKPETLGKLKKFCWVVPEYSFMSTKPGIGRNALDRIIKQIDKSSYVTRLDGLNAIRIGGKVYPADRYIKQLAKAAGYHLGSASGGDVIPLDLNELERLDEIRYKEKQATIKEANQRKRKSRI